MKTKLILLLVVTLGMSLNAADEPGKKIVQEPLPEVSIQDVQTLSQKTGLALSNPTASFTTAHEKSGSTHLMLSLSEKDDKGKILRAFWTPYSQWKKEGDKVAGYLEIWENEKRKEFYMGYFPKDLDAVFKIPADEDIIIKIVRDENGKMEKVIDRSPKK